MPKEKIMNFISKVKGYGFTALAAGGAAVVFFVFGNMFATGVATGIFVTRNWDIIKKYFQENIDF